jgi:HAMP domain-containing protein
MRKPHTLLAAATLAVLAVWSLSAEGAQAKKTYLLRSGRKAGDTDRIAVQLVVGGDLKEVVDDKIQQTKMRVEGSFSYDEKTLEVPGKSVNRSRSARYYHKVDVVINAEDDVIKPVLRPQRRLIGVAIELPKATLFSPQGTLTREELDLIDILANSLLLDRLLPEKPVAIGESWKHPEEVLVALLGLDAVRQSDVQSVLKEVTDTVARMELSGRVEGAVGGVSTEIELKAKYRFDLKTKRIDWLGLLAKEQRSIGHVERGFDAVAQIELRILPGAGSSRLTDATLEHLPLKPTAELIQLSHTSTEGRWQITHDRRWYVSGDHRELAILRRIDRGEFIAQCNISALPKLEPGKQITLAEFQKDVQKALGESFGEFVQAGQWANERDYRVCRVVIGGEVSELPIQWNYYLVADKYGHQVAFAFTVEQKLAEGFGKADEELIRSFRFLDPALASNSQP